MDGQPKNASSNECSLSNIYPMSSQRDKTTGRLVGLSACLCDANCNVPHGGLIGSVKGGFQLPLHVECGLLWRKDSFSRSQEEIDSSNLLELPSNPCFELL